MNDNHLEAVPPAGQARNALEARTQLYGPAVGRDYDAHVGHTHVGHRSEEVLSIPRVRGYGGLAVL